MTDAPGPNPDGLVVAPERLADLAAIRDLAVSYAYAVDDRDWERWEALFLPDAAIDYTSAGGIAGQPAEMATWMRGALGVFTFCMHSILTHEIRFTGPDRATGRVHVFNRNGVTWEGRPEIFDVGGTYEDTYVRAGDAWRFASRTERTAYFAGGGFADMIRSSVAAAGPDEAPRPG